MIFEILNIKPALEMKELGEQYAGPVINFINPIVF